MASRQTLKNGINKILADNTNKRYTDNGWIPVHGAFNILEHMGFKVEFTGTRYSKDAEGRPNVKTWTFEIPFGTRKPFYGILTAHGAGSVADPLDVYDITAYVS